MTSVEKRDQIVTWDGNPATWTEYVKRVRFQYEKTEPRKRRLLGAELASRLTNRAWEVTAAEIDRPCPASTKRWSCISSEVFGGETLQSTNSRHWSET